MTTQIVTSTSNPPSSFPAVTQASSSGGGGVGTATEVTLAAASAKLPASLGAKTGAASMSVVPATDAPFSTVADNYAKVVASNILTRPANVTPYDSGQIVGVTGGLAAGRFIFPGLARINGGAVRLDRLRLYKSQATAVGSFQLWLFRGDPASVGIADRAVASAQVAVGNAASALRLAGRVSFDMTGAAVGSDGAEVAGITITGPAILALAGAAETALYGVLVATGSYVPLSGETFSIVAEGYAF